MKSRRPKTYRIAGPCKVDGCAGTVTIRSKSGYCRRHRWIQQEEKRTSRRRTGRAEYRHGYYLAHRDQEIAAACAAGKARRTAKILQELEQNRKHRRGLREFLTRKAA